MTDAPHVVDVRLWPEQPDAYSLMPLHAQVRSIIEGHLQRDGYQVGDQLPGEEQLCEHFAVSRPTLRHALADLQAEAWIERRPGIATTIIRAPIPVWLLTVDPRRSFTAPVGEDPSENTTVEVTRRFLEVAEPEVAEVLGTGQALAIDRVLRRGDLPVASCRTWLPWGGCEELLSTPLLRDSISQTLIERYGRHPSSRQVRIRGLRAGQAEAKLFKVPPRSPVLEVRTAERDDLGDVLWCATTFYNGAVVDLELPSMATLPLPESDDTAAGVPVPAHTDGVEDGPPPTG
jgi:DNA-binding GntR family transcriptional regulator